MQNQWKRPAIPEVQIQDPFWTPYLKQIRQTMLPYVFDHMALDGYVENFRMAAKKQPGHHGPYFSDGLLLETIRAACDFLAVSPDAALKARIDELVEDIISAQAPDGYLVTAILQDAPEKRWGENGGDIVVQHDLYDQGALIEAAISHYSAFGEMKLLRCAVRAANNICAYMGEAPKQNRLPGHSLPEEAFVKLYRLFRDHRELDAFAAENQVNPQEYLRIARFWYDVRGDRSRGREATMSKHFTPEYNQDHLPFTRQTRAVGHSVRATLCYTGAAAVQYETDAGYAPALTALWENVTKRKMHISGGIGTRHDIEGFDGDYNLPNDAYLETCAGVGLAFWGGEMSLLAPKSTYFDVFERALYNNVLAAVAPDAQHYFYQNPLQSDGSIRRWEWHGCPCCPPMILKLLSALGSYIYAYRAGELCVNLKIDSRYANADCSVTQENGEIRLDSFGKPFTLRIRIPEYAANFALTQNGQPLPYAAEDGYAVCFGVWSADQPICCTYDTPPRRICANPNVSADVGKVAFMQGAFLLCAEGVDNGGDVAFTVAENPHLFPDAYGVCGLTASGKPFRLIPYYRWCQRGEGENDRKMAVWFRQEHMRAVEMGDALYADYDA